MKGFDLGSFLAQQETVSKLDTSAGRERYERIDIDLLDPDPENFYSMDGLEELAENILLCGLLQPIRVKPGEMPGRFTVMAGHRRRAALRLLVDGGHEEFRMVPCIRDGGGSDTLQELKLIYANSDNRDLTDAELGKQALKVEMLLYRLQEEGYQFSGRMRDRVAEICKISAPKLARLKVIREGLIPAYMELFEKDKLPEQTAYALARLPGEFQERLNRVLDKPPAGTKAEKLLAKYDDGWRWEPELTCPDGKSCKRGDAFLRRDCESSGWSEMCGGNTCCLNCDMAKQAYSPCERMCSKARAVRKEKSDQKKAAEHERMVKNGRKYQKETERNARRLLRAIDAAGLSDADQIPWEYYTKYSVAVIRKWAAGEFDDPAGWSYAKLVPEKCYELMDAAKLLGCSTDFLMGLTEEITPIGAASTGALPDCEPEVLGAEEETTGPDEAMAPARRQVRWESRGRTPPEGKPILTWSMTNSGEVWRAAQWNGRTFVDPGKPEKELTGLQYQQWMEIPPRNGAGGYDTEAPVWGWWPETPTESGLYWCITGPLTKGGGLYWWEATTGQWEHAGAKGVVLTPNIVLWMACPELPESMRWERPELDG